MVKAYVSRGTCYRIPMVYSFCQVNLSADPIGVPKTMGASFAFTSLNILENIHVSSHLSNPLDAILIACFLSSPHSMLTSLLQCRTTCINAKYIGRLMSKVKTRQSTNKCIFLRYNISNGSISPLFRCKLLSQTMIHLIMVTHFYITIL